jgi:hypothetical protein
MYGTGDPLEPPASVGASYALLTATQPNPGTLSQTLAIARTCVDHPFILTFWVMPGTAHGFAPPNGRIQFSGPVGAIGDPIDFTPSGGGPKEGSVLTQQTVSNTVPTDATTVTIEFTANGESILDAVDFTICTE